MKKDFPVESKHVTTNVLIDVKLSKDKQQIVNEFSVYFTEAVSRGFTSHSVIFVSTLQILQRSVFSTV